MSDEMSADLSPETAAGKSPAEYADLAAMTAAAHAELSSIVLAEQPLGAVLRRVAELAVKTVPGTDDASVTLIEQGRPQTVAFYGQLAVALDERQYEAGFGPCLDAAQAGRTIHVDTENEAGAYPGFARQARRQGVRHVLAVPLPIRQRTGGALNLYAHDGPFSPVASEIAASLASNAAVTLFNATAYAGALAEITQMKEAMASRAVIEQAKGIIMIQEHCTADEAFKTLVRVSSMSNRKIRDLAREIVQRATLS